MALLFPYRLAAAALALMPIAAPARSQHPLQQQQPFKPERAPVGLPLYTSDGKAVGRIVATGVDEDDKPVLVAEIERPQGIGPRAIAIPADLFVRKPDRIELTISAAEVDARLGR